MINILLGKDIKIQVSNGYKTCRIFLKLPNSNKWISKILDNFEKIRLGFILEVLYYENKNS